MRWLCGGGGRGPGRTHTKPVSNKAMVWVGEKKLTNKRQPHELETNDGEYGEGDPEDRLTVDGEPEEATIGRVDGLGAGLAALEDPVAVAGGRVDLIPPAQTDEASTGDVLQVVEVHGQQQDGDDEDHDHVVREDDAKEVDEKGGCG